MKKLLYVSTLLLFAIFGTTVYASPTVDKVFQECKKSHDIDKCIQSKIKITNRAKKGGTGGSPFTNLYADISKKPNGCSNGDFEGSFADWQGFRMKHSSGITPVENGLTMLSPFLSNACADNTYGDTCVKVENGGTSPIVPSISTNISGKSMRLGGNGTSSTGYAAEGIAKKFVVTAANSIYYFKYAIVMDVSHPGGSSAFFQARAIDSSGNTVDVYNELANASNPFIKKTSQVPHGYGTQYYRDWRCAKLDLSSHIGQEVVVYFLNSDCAAGGHRATTYIDDVCVVCDNSAQEGNITATTKPCLSSNGSTVSGSVNWPNITGITNKSIELKIYQNGTLVGTVTNPTISGNSYSFDINKTVFPNSNCFDIVVEQHYSIPDMNGNLQEVVNYSSESKGGKNEGLVPGENNDICLDCNNSDDLAPKQCLSVEPKLTCSKAGWRVELNSFTPTNYSASNTDITVLAPSGVTATKWGSKWYLNGANAGDTIRLNLHGADTGAGKFKDGDLCCDGEVNVTIPQDQNCTPSYPEINVMKSYKDGVFKLHLGLLGEVDAPQVLTIIDRVPAGITITGIDPRSTSSWACSNSFPVSGSANLVCGYIGSMPVSGTQELFLTATIDSKESVTNCMDVGIIQSDGTSIYIDPQQASCVTVDNNQTDDNNTENNSTGCQTDADCPSGYCHQGMCIIPDDGNNTNGGTDDNGTTGADVPLTCSSNIIIVADESGSIAEAGAINNVKDAIRNLVKGYKGNGSKAAVIHFSNNAQLVKPMTTIETAGVAPNQENAFTNGYNPTVGQTNWEAGLKEALNQVNANPGPEIVFFITDGQPNKYLDANGNVQSGSEAQSVAEAVAVANQINSSGGRIVAIGVGDISSSATAQSNLNQIASSNEDAIVGQTSDLNSIIGEYVTKSCSDIFLKKYISPSSVNLHTQDINSYKPVVTLSVTNSSPSNMTNIVVEDALPAPKMTYNSTVSQSVGTVSSVPSNRVRWTIPTLAPNATAVAKFKVNVSGVAGDKIKNYAQVVSIDQNVASLPSNLANPVTGPLNLSDKDEGYSYISIYDYNTTGGSSGCDPNTSPDKCLSVTKKYKYTEGNCMPGHQCVYDVTIHNNSNVPYTGNINITDSMTPASLGANITVTANGSAPTPICSPNPTAIPFSCIQSTDLPAYATWTYTITMSSVPQGAVKNCFKAGASAEKCFNFPSSNKSKPQPDIPVVITPTKPDVKPKPIIDKPKPVDEKPKPLIVVSRGNLSLYKRGPKVCKAGGICTFTLTVKNRGRGTYTGPATVQDRSREFRGKLIKTRGKGWRCRTTRGGYVCNNPKLRLRAGASSQIKLSIRIPKRAKGYLTNCAKLDVLQGSNRVRAIQTMLLAAGYNTGAVNGSMNKRTIRALKAYARASGLKGKKAQRVAIKRLLAKYPFIRSKNSCVKVKIKESKPECKRGQHFNGKQCVTCPRGSYWDKKHRRCVAKQVVKTCPRGYVLYKNRCYKEQRRSECPRGQEIDKRTGTCKRKLDVGTVLNIINVVGNIIGGGGGGKPDKEPHHKGGI